MTPAELRAVRERAERATEAQHPISVAMLAAVPLIEDIPALCNALEEAWAEIERLRE